MRLEEAGIFKALRVRAESRLYGSLVFKKNTAMYREWIFIRLQLVSIRENKSSLISTDSYDRTRLADRLSFPEIRNFST